MFFLSSSSDLGLQAKLPAQDFSACWRDNPAADAHRSSSQSWKFDNMIEVIVNDRLGKKVRVKCNEDDSIGDLKKLVAALTGAPCLLGIT